MDNLKVKKLALLRKKQELIRNNKLKHYDPYPFQVKFHNDMDERRGLRCGNQQGKTMAGCAQDAMDLTGMYPDWYEGRRFDHPVSLMAGSINNDKTRDLLQKALCGDPTEKLESLGTGWIPKDCLSLKKVSLKRGVTNAFAHVKVKHHTNGVFDGWSTLSFSSYAEGDEGWMGDTIDIYHLDEEPPLGILSQSGRGCIASGGIIRITWTPEKGRTDVVMKVEEDYSLHTASLADAAGEEFDYTFEDGEVIHFKPIKTINGNTGHITKRTLELMEKDNLPYMMKMRVMGLPVAGTGLVFGYSDIQIKINPIPLADHWKRIDALDFGGMATTSHPTAFVRLAWDEDNDVVYIYDGFRVKGKEIPEIAAMIVAKPHSDIIPVIWPHDGNKTLGQGAPTKDQYAACGVNMFYNEDWPEKSHFTNPPDEFARDGSGGIQIMPGLTKMSSRMHDMTLKVFSTVEDFFLEKQSYHMKDGAPVPRDDDFISASRYGVMSLRHCVELKQEPIILNRNIERASGWMGA